MPQSHRKAKTHWQYTVMGVDFNITLLRIEIILLTTRLLPSKPEKKKSIATSP